MWKRSAVRISDDSESWIAGAGEVLVVLDTSILIDAL